MEFRPIQSMFNGRVLSGVIQNDLDITDPVQFLTECLPIFIVEISKQLDLLTTLKVNTELNTEFIVKKGDEEFLTDMNFVTKMKIINRTTDLREWFEVNVIDEMLRKITEFCVGYSGKALSCIFYLQLNICNYDPLNSNVGSTWLDLPAGIKLKKACVNVKNFGDECCFFWSVTSAIFPAKKNVDRLASYPHFKTKFKIDNIRIPVPLDDIPVFEFMNGISINVFGLGEKNEIIGPLYKTRKKRSKHVNLLLFSRHGKGHYVWIKDLSKLIGSQLSNAKVKKYVCDSCLLYFHDVNEYREHEKKNDCSPDDKAVQLILPKPGENILKFKNFGKKLRQPFILYCDIECILPKIQSADPNPNKPFVLKKSLHVPCAVGYVFRYFQDDNCRFAQVITGQNCVEEFILKLKEFAKLVNEIYDNPIPLKMTREDREDFKLATHCHICEKPFTDPSDRVPDHCHFSKGEGGSNYRGAAHRLCNLQFFPRRIVSCLWHNGSKYDFRILVKAINNADPNLNISVLPLSTENYISFSIKIDGVEFRFLDSYRFLQSSLDSLVSITGKEKLHATRAFFGEQKWSVMASKGIFPYEYCTSWESLDETCLPPREQFYSSLTDSTVSEKDYERALRVWDVMGCETLKDYMEAYLFSDCLLLHDVYESFRDFCLRVDGLDPAWYYTLAGLSFDSMLKMTKVDIELLTEQDKIEFLEKALRGGLVQASGRYAKANNRYMKTYDPNLPETFILYLDINNEYGWALTQKLPIGNFEWVQDVDNFDVDSVDTEKVGYFLQVDLSIAEEDHVRFRDLPLAPTHGVPPGSKTSKLLATLEPKKDYVIHIDILRFYKSLGMRIDKIHRILRFDHSAWMAPYIEMNTRLREKATSAFEKNLFKLKNNACYGKSIEQVRKRRDIKLITKWGGRGGARKLISSPNFQHFSAFSGTLAAIELKKTEINYDKPIFVGSAVLDLSKFIFYKLYYQDIKPYFGESLSLLYVDTDSFIFKIVNSDPYEFIKSHSHLFDTSEYPPDNAFGIQLLNKKKIGLVKDEANGKQIAEYVGLRSKMYAYRMDEDDSSTRKAKGLSRVVLRRLTFQNYKDCLFGGKEYQPVYNKQQNIESRRLELFTIERNKSTLSSNDDKRILLDNFETLPYGYLGPQ